MAKPLTRPSTPKLSEAARHVVIPEGIVTTGWPRIEKRLHDMAVEFDPWQQGIAKCALGKTKHGKYAATVGGVTLSIPRQVGKTFMIGSLIIAMCLEYPGLQVVWTAHHLRTSTKTFRSMQAMVKRKKVAPHLAEGRNDGIRTANGEQEIAFRNGSMIYFGARAQGFGRGFDEIDIMVFDEAQILTDKALEDMIAATNQARHAHGALLFYMGTPPRPTDPGEAFSNKRRKALKGELANGIYIECSADRDGDINDPHQWRTANASYPERTPHESMLRLRENLPNDDAWRREGLGVWDEFEAAKLVMPKWHDRTDHTQPAAPAALGIAVDLDRIWVSVGAASLDEIPHLGPVSVMVDDKPTALRLRLDEDLDMVVKQVARIQRESNCAVVLDRKGPAGSLEKAFTDGGVIITPAGLDDVCTGSVDLYDAIKAGRAVHGGYSALNDAVTAADWRTVGDRKAWGRKSGEISMLEAVTLALWGVKHKPAPRVPLGAFG